MFYGSNRNYLSSHIIHIFSHDRIVKESQFIQVFPCDDILSHWIVPTD